MKIRVKLAVLFYEIIVLFVVVILALFVTHVISIDTVFSVMNIIYFEPKMRLLFGLIAVILFLKTYMMSRTICGVYQKERNIAFDNPAGRVYVTLTAIEDLIRRVLFQLEEIRDAKISVTVRKGGELRVETRLTLNGDYNIPEMTSRIQKVIQQKIERTIGADHKISVEADVIKILSPEAKGSKTQKKALVQEDRDDANVPFEGYRA